MSGFFSRWLRRTSPTSDAPVARSRRIQVPVELETRVARWFASDPPDRVALAVETLRCLADASPQWLQPAPDIKPLAWLIAALDRLEALPDPLPIPPQAPTLAWRYLLLTRLLGDELETLYTAAWRQGWATRCPLTDRVDPFPPARALHRARDRARLDSTGLAALIGGSRLPLAGQQHLYAAHLAGIDWTDSVAFWRAFAAVEPGAIPAPSPPAADAALPVSETVPPPTASVASVPDAPKRTVAPAPLPSPPAIGTAARADSMAGRIPTASATASIADAEPPRADSAPAADPWSAVVCATLAALITGPRFNRQAGDAWFQQGAFYVSAKAFAETLYLHSWVQTQPGFGNRKTLYRQLAARRLIVTDGAQKIWPLFISENPDICPRYVSALKIAATVVAGLTPSSEFRGSIRPASEQGRAVAPFVMTTSG